MTNRSGYSLEVNKKALGSMIAMVLVLGSTGCSNSGAEVSNKSQKEIYFDRLDELAATGASGNLLSCMYILKASSFLDGVNAEELTESEAIGDALAEAKRRSQLSASGELLEILETGVGNQFEFCGTLGEVDYSIGEYKTLNPEPDEVQVESGSSVWQNKLDMTNVGTWVERSEEDWQQNVGQQYLFVNNVNCLLYVFDEYGEDKDVMQKAYQWLAQYSGIHLAGSNWILMDSSYGEKCTGPVTDLLGGYRLN